MASESINPQFDVLHDKSVEEDFNRKAPLLSPSAQQFSNNRRTLRDVLNESNDAALATSRTNEEMAADTVKNILSGAVTGVTGTLALGADLLGSRDGAEYLSRLTDSIQKASEDAGSDAEKAMARIYQRKQAQDEVQSQALYEKERATEGEVIASAHKILRDAKNATANAFSSGHYGQVMSQGLGSIGTDILLSGGIGAVAKGGAKATLKFAPGFYKGVAKTAKEAVEATPLLGKVAQNTPWMLASGLQEGGGQYTQDLLEALDTSIADLEKNSPEFRRRTSIEYLRQNDPEFNRRVVELAKQGKDIGLAQEEARARAARDLAFEMARQSALETGAVAAGLSWMTKGLQKPFTKGAQSVRKFIGEGLLEIPEEGGSEAGGQIASNLAKQKYIDENQQWSEGVGQSLAEGGIGGMGFGAIRAPGAIAKSAVETTTQVINNYRASRQGNFEQSEEGISKNLQEAGIEADKLDKVRAEAGDKNPVFSNLQSQLDKAYTTAFASTTDEEGKTSSILSDRDALRLLVATSSYSDQINNLSSPDEANKDTTEAFKNKAQQSNEAIRNKVLSVLQERAEASKEGWQGTNLTQSQLDTEGAYLTSLFISGKQEEFMDRLKSYPTGVLSTISNSNFTNPIVNSVLKNSFGRNEEDTSGEESQVSEAPSAPNPAPTPSSNPVPGNNGNSRIHPIDGEGYRGSNPSGVDPIDEHNLKPGDRNKRGYYITSPITGRGAHHWQDTSVNEVEVGGKPGTNPKGKLTRPGTAPTQWNGQEISTIKDNEGHQAVGKFYSYNGSEYVYTKEGTTRRVKFVEPNESKRHDQGVNNWLHTVFLDEKDPIYKKFTETLSGREVFIDLVKDKKLKVDCKTGELFTRDSIDSSWRPLTQKDFTPKLVASGKVEDQTHRMAVKQQPSVNDVLIEFEIDKDGVVTNFHPSGGIGYVEPTVNQQQKPSKPELEVKNNPPAESPKDSSKGRVVSNVDGKSQLLEYLQVGDKGFIIKTPSGKFVEVTVPNWNQIKNNPEDIFQYIRDNNDSISDVIISLDPEVKNAQSLKDYKNPIELIKKEIKAVVFNSDGTISYDTYDNEAKVLEFTDKLGSSFTEIFTPVVRGFHLLLSDHPIKAFTNLFQVKQTATEYLRSNHFTNAFLLARNLYWSPAARKFLEYADVQYLPNSKNSLMTKILSMLNPKGGFMKRLDQNKDLLSLTEEDLKQNPRAYELVKKIFYNEDGTIKENFDELFRISTVHATSIFGAYSHQFTDEELKSIHIDPYIPGNKDITQEGLPMPMAMNHFVSSMRKFMGVAQANEASRSDMEAALGLIAQKYMRVLKASGIISVSEVTYQTVNYDPETKKKKNIANKVKTITVNKDWKGIFGEKANILEQLIDPTMRNAWSTEPVEPTGTIAHTAVPLTKTLKATAATLNRQPSSIALRTASAFGILGGANGFSYLFDNFDALAEESDRAPYYNKKYYETLIGRYQSRKTAYGVIYEVILGNMDKDLSTVKIYQDYMVAKNSRLHQKGAATQQANNILRQLFINRNADTLDLSDSSSNIVKCQKMCLAQGFGVSTSRVLEDSYLEDIDKVLEYLDKKAQSEEYSELLNLIIAPDPVTIINDPFRKDTKLLDQMKNFIKEFNNDFKNEGLEITEKHFNALIEALAYNQAKKNGDLKNFSSEITLEVDGTNDGPSWINKYLTLAMAGASEEYVENLARTGTFLFLNGTMPEAMAPETDLAKMSRTQGTDLHKRVAKEISTNILSRIAQLNKVIKSGSPEMSSDEAKLALNCTGALLNIFKATGQIRSSKEGEDLSIAEVLRYSDTSKEAPFVFDREISKKLTTIIPYGSEVSGSTNAVLKEVLDVLYSQISEVASSSVSKFETLSNEETSKFFNGVPFSRVMSSLQYLLKCSYDPEEGFMKGEETAETLAKKAKNFSRTPPTLRDFANITVDAFGNIKNKSNNPDIRLFELTGLGLSKLVELAIPLFGEPAQAAVNKIISTEGMRASTIPAATASIATVIAQGVEQLQEELAGGSLTEVSLKEEYEARKKVRELGATFDTGSGARYVIDNSEYATAENNLVTDPNGEFNYAPSREKLGSAGVSGGPLAIHAAGDTSVVINLVKELENTINFLEVFDGIYGTADVIEDICKAANKASSKAMKQFLITNNLKRLKAIGDDLNKFGYSQAKGLDAIIDCIGNLIAGKLINGEEPKNVQKLSAASISYSINGLIKKLNRSYEFNPNIRKAQKLQVENKKQGFTSGNEVERLYRDLGKYFRDLETISRNEQVYHAVVDNLPRTDHHMAGVNAPYTLGGVLTMEEASELMELFHDLYGVDKNDKGTQTKLISAYINGKATIVQNEKFPNFNKNSLEYLQQRDLTKRDVGNSGLLEMTPEHVEKFEIFVKDKRKSTFVKEKSSSSKTTRVISSREVKQAFEQVAKNYASGSSTASSIFKNLLERVRRILPTNMNIIFTTSVDNLSPELSDLCRSAKNNLQQRGFYIHRQGKEPILVVLDPSGKFDINDEENATTIVHECIHASLSNAVSYYVNGNTEALTAEQFGAFKNLESLLDDMDNLIWPGDIVPEVIQRLKKIINPSGEQTSKLSKSERAVRLDEAIAYILSNKDAFDQLSKTDLTEEGRGKHNSQFLTVLKNILQAVRKIYRRIFSIVNGSSLDNIIEDKKQNNLTFLELFGANTVSIVEIENSYFDGTPYTDKISKAREKANINADIDYVRFSSPFSAKFTEDNIKQQFDNSLEQYKKRAKEHYLGLSRFSSKGYSNQLKKIFPTVTREFVDYLNNLTTIFNEAGLNSIDSDIPGKAALYTSLNQQEGFLTDTQRKDLTRIFIEARKQLQKEPFIKKYLEGIKNPTKEDSDRASKVFDLLTGSNTKILDLGNPKVLGVQNFQRQAVFYSLLTVDKNAARAVDSIKIPLKQENGSIASVGLNRVIENKIFNRINRQAYKALNDRSVEQIYKDFVAQTIAESTSAMQSARDLAETLEDKFDKTLLNLLLLPFSLKKSNKEVAEAIKGIRDESLDPFTKRSQIAEILRMINNSNVPKFFVNWVADIYGRVGSNSELQSLLKTIKGYQDKVRKEQLDEIADLMVKKFGNYKVTDKDRAFFDRVIGQTDLSVLTDELAKEVVTDKKRLREEIAKRESWLKDHSSVQQEQIQKGKQLANYFSGSREAGHNLLTNATAVSDLVGTDNFHHAQQEVVATLDALITLYCLEHLTDQDRATMRFFYKNHEEAINTILYQVRQAKDKEKERIKTDAHKYNAIKGWRPEGSIPKGNYKIIPKKKFERYRKMGYQNLGEYKHSNIDPSEPMIRIWSEYPHETELQEGIIQTIKQTAHGYRVQEGTRAEAQGARITDTDHARRIYNNYEKESDSCNLIPLYDSMGLVIGYERSIPPEDRALLENKRDLITGVTQYRTRQIREEFAGKINQVAIDTAYNHYMHATEAERKREFIDVLHSNDLAIKRAVARFDGKTRRRIRERFGGDHFQLRKDEVEGMIGYYRPSLTDMQDNTFFLPKGVEDAITHYLDKLPGGRARMQTGRLETGIIGISSQARNTIVIRSGIVPAINAISNVVLLHTIGIPLKEIKNYITEGVKDTEEYNKLMHKDIKLGFMLDNLKQRIIDLENTNPNNPKIKVLKDQEKLLETEKNDNILLMKNLPAYELITKGEYATISPEGMLNEEVDIWRQKAEDLVTAFLSKHFKHGESYKKQLSEALMTRGSESFTFMAKATNYGDWIAKLATYRYLTSGKNEFKTKFTPEQARAAAANIFVDYDQFVGKERDWFNRIGLTWFMTFKQRMLASLSMGMMLHPSRMMLSSLFGSVIGIGTPLTDNIVTKTLNGSIEYSIGMVDTWLRALLLHPLAFVAKAL